VVVRDFVSGAMENTSASTFMEAVQSTQRELIDKSWDDIIAHELFHQWFGDLVTIESWANLPLNESFANYAQYLWDEYKYGKDEADYQAFREKQQYLYESTRKQEPMIRFEYKKPDDMFDSHSYAKGGRILHMLRRLVGDEAFFESLKEYLHQNAFQNTEIHHLRLAFEKVTGKDLNWFFNQWFLLPGHPELVID
jgi:aminopeptidase N